MSRLLLKRPFIPYIPELAEKLGTMGSLILSVISHWVYENASKDHNLRNGRYWTYNTMNDWLKYFPGESLRTLHRDFDKLEKSGLLISGYYHEDPRNRTKWYTIDFEKYDVLMEDVDSSDEVWNKIRNAALKNALCQNGRMGGMGDTEDDYGKSLLQPSNDALCQNGNMDSAKMAECIYNRNSNYRDSSNYKKGSMKNFDEKRIGIEFDSSFITNDWKQSVLAAHTQWDMKEIDRGTKEFIANKTGKRSHDWHATYVEWFKNRDSMQAKYHRRKSGQMTDDEIWEKYVWIHVDKKLQGLMTYLYHYLGREAFLGNKLYLMRVAHQEKDKVAVGCSELKQSALPSKWREKYGFDIEMIVKMVFPGTAIVEIL